MLSLSHTIISLPFGLIFTNPIAIFFIACISHLVLDMFLHWNIYPHHYKSYPFVLVGIDVLSGLLVSYLLLQNTLFTLPILAAIAGGNAPDILHAFWGFMGKNRQQRAPKFVQAVFQFHEEIQWETESPLLGGLSQVIIGGMAILLTLVLR